MFLLKIAFAGLWPLIWHFGIIAGIGILALAFAWFSPVFKKTALWVALSCLIIGFTAATYVRLGEQRVRAQWDAANAEAARIAQENLNKAAAHDRELIKQAEADRTRTQKRAHEIEAQISTGVCFTADDTDWLRRFWSPSDR